MNESLNLKDGLQIKPGDWRDSNIHALLLLADPDQDLLAGYILKAKIFVVDYKAEVAGVIALEPQSNKVLEIKNIAVNTNFQGRGIGRYLMDFSEEYALDHDFKTLKVATGNSSLGPLHLYRSLGFEIVEVHKDYFVKNYPDPIYENGIQCRDQIILRKILST